MSSSCKRYLTTSILIAIVVNMFRYFINDYVESNQVVGISRAITLIFDLSYLPLILVILFMYRFIYIEKENIRLAQLPITDKQKILIPIVVLSVIMVIFDLIILFNIEDIDWYFISMIKRYFIIILTFLAIVLTRNIIKIIIFTSFLSLAIGYGFEMSYGFVSISIIAIIVFAIMYISIIVLGLYIHLNYLKRHNDELLEIAFYLEAIIVAFIFIKYIFILKYPYEITTLSLRIGDYSFSVLYYTLVFLFILLFTFIKYKKFDLKAIMIPSLFILMITICYVGYNELMVDVKDECQNIIKSKKDKKYIIGNSYNLVAKIDLSEKQVDYLVNNSLKCNANNENHIYENTFTKINDTKLRKNKISLIKLAYSDYKDKDLVREKNYFTFIKQSEEQLTKLLDLGEVNELSLITLKNSGVEYRMLYLPKSLSKKQKDLIIKLKDEKKFDSDKYKLVLLNDDKGKKLFDRVMGARINFLGNEHSNYSFDFTKVKYASKEDDREVREDYIKEKDEKDLFKYLKDRGELK